MQQLVPLVLKGTEGKSCSPDFKAAAFMILVQLASRAVLADKLLECASWLLGGTQHVPLPAASEPPVLMSFDPLLDPGARPMHASS